MSTTMGRLDRLISRLSTPSTAAGPPADVEPTAAAAADEETGFRERARLRRRLRYLRQTRELAFRDLGGFVFDSHRFGRERADIVNAKLGGLVAMTRELQALETALNDRRELLVLEQPGISVCPRCGVIHGSEARFCPGCALPLGSGMGLPLGNRVPSAEPGATEQPTSETGVVSP